MRKTLTVAGVLVAGFALPMLSGGTAYAADTSAAVDKAKIVVASGGGCTTTYVNDLEGNHIGSTFTVSGYDVTVHGNAVLAYEGATVSDTKKAETCLV